MSYKGNRIKQRKTFTLAKLSIERLDTLHEALDISRSEIIDRAIKLYFKKAIKSGWLDNKED